MALPDVFRVQSGTTKTFASSGGDALLTMTSVANNAARQSDKIDLGATRAPRYAIEVHMEFAATPTAGNALEIHWAGSSSATAGTDNPGGVSGADSAYTGYSSNLDASVKQLRLLGAMTVTAQATATVQKQTLMQTFEPYHRYGTLVVYNKSGAAIHSSPTNCKVILRPLEDVIEDA